MSLCYERENSSLGILYRPIRSLCSDKIMPADNSWMEINFFLSEHRLASEECAFQRQASNSRSGTHEESCSAAVTWLHVHVVT